MLYCNRIPKKKAGKIYENTTRSIKLRFIFSKYISRSPIPRPKLQLIRVKDSKKVFLWTYERNGFINLNVKVSPAWRDFWRDAFPSVIPGWHQNKDNWNTIILDGSIPDDAIKNMISDSYDLVTYNPTRLIYEAVKRIPKGCVATYAQVAELAGNKKMCRAVGNALHKNPNPDEIPCYRVVNAKGELSGAFAFGGADEQANRLRADGIEVIDGRVDLDKYGIRIVDDVIYTKTTVEPLT